ncbi:uncharacterized protein SPAPADRAFT_50369 [Spathaspora passalidarum NRRL Y-27907]|uniref:Uncharacterized protein n=1 Tax=Spathaspora passalidarum (strain NRRL Y-27907 / 11-Y1) TaxID=619300 RepID=G3AMP9_SPAPN|nr:uncharacterized protein SPAPADRAFT_50369 [Spathaspora passalidarum NRRL Y-27907]EGW33493.1 hypothetical protein SPAPADRAFT_50369 [Spathaspora passalidarum NRRL Y-27907]
MDQFLPVQSYNAFFTSMQSCSPDILQVEDPQPLHKPCNQILFPVESKSPQNTPEFQSLFLDQPFHESNYYGEMLERSCPEQLLEKSDQQGLFPNASTNYDALSFNHEPQHMQEQIKNDEPVQIQWSSSDSSPSLSQQTTIDSDDYSDSENPVVPGLFPTMNIDDDSQFMKTDSLPLTPSYICQ